MYKLVMEDEKLKEFEEEPVTYVETTDVKDGVTCDVYRFTDTDEKDLGVVHIVKGSASPRQRVLTGEKTIQMFREGAGTLEVTDRNGRTVRYHYPYGTAPKAVEVNVGEVMQWFANGETDLSFYEICYPPYEEGRFEEVV